MERDCARQLTVQALQAVESLSTLLNVAEGRVSEPEYERLKRAVGVILDQVQCDVLDPIYQQHPHLGE